MSQKTESRFASLFTRLRSEPVALGLLVVVSFLVRVIGVGYGLPNPYVRPDESHFVLNEAILLRYSFFRPMSFFYPGLVKYLCFFNGLGLHLIRRIMGLESSYAEFAGNYLVDPTSYFLINRMLSVVAGALTVWVIWRLIRKHVSASLALAGAALIGLNAFHVRDSHFIKIDVIALLFNCLAYYSALNVLRDGRRRDSLWAGVFIGLSAGSRYNGALIGISLAAAQFFWCWEHRSSKKVWVDGIRNVVLAGLMAAVVFAATSPSFLVHPKDSFLGLKALSAGLHRGLVGGEWPPGWRFFLFEAFPAVLGVPLYVVTIVALLWGLAFRGRVVIVLLASLIPYFILLLPDRVLMIRHALPLLPCAIVFCVLLLDAAVRRFRMRPHWGVLLLLGVCLPGQLYAIYHSDRLLATTDTRVLARRWIERHVPPNSRFYFPTAWGNPALIRNEAVYQILSRIDPNNMVYRLIRLSPEFYRIKKYVIIDKGAPNLDWFIHEVSLEEFRAKRVDFIVVHNYPSSPFSNMSANKALLEILAKDYDEICHISPFRAGLPAPPELVLDRQDAFYVPLWDFGEVDRPGPEIFIYRRRNS